MPHVYCFAGQMITLARKKDIITCRYQNEMATAALEVLQVATLIPACRAALLHLAEEEDNDTADRDPMSVLLSAASGRKFRFDMEVKTSIDICDIYARPCSQHEFKMSSTLVNYIIAECALLAHHQTKETQ